MNEVINYEQVKDKIITIREQQVILDSDIAGLYGVETKHINQAVSNNPEKFPDGYVLELDKKEFRDLRSKFLTANLSMTRTSPKAFTEKGLYMLATILKSPRAVQTTLTIVETFAQLRELARNVVQLSTTKDEAGQRLLAQKSGDIIADILGENMVTTDTETSYEIDLALLKFKHTVRRKQDKQDKSPSKKKLYPFEQSSEDIMRLT
ncbi:MAG: ORF6N domain-containing protein [Bacteroidales bacterium]|jgi:hypothetical protein|nr:ORF6N domain-containing protein [Bacteroidales bacterium]